MKVSRTATYCFEIWYESRASIVAASAFLAAASSRILTGSIDWRAVLIVALCTASAYCIDDFIDFRRDLERPRFHFSANIRFIKLLAAVFSTLIAIVALQGRPFALAELLLSSGLLTLAFCLASSRIRREVRLSHLWVSLRTVYVSLVWSFVVVLTPVLDRSGPVDFFVFTSIAFIFVLMLPVSALWAEGEHPERQKSQHASIAYDRMMLFSCASASFLMIFGIVRGLLPWQNVALLPACIANALFISFRRRFSQVDPRVINEAMILMNLLACLFVIGAYAHPDTGFGPKTIADWFQLAACAVFFGNIALKSAALQAQDDEGDYFDFLIFLGMGILGFQILVASVHVEGWLFPILHWRFFESQLASVLGVLIMGVAIILQSAAYISMSSSWRLMATSSEPSSLITTGPFAFTRNPIYVSSEAYIAGVFLMNGTLVFALFLLLTPIVLHVQIRREEAFLLDRYAENYTRYLRKTPRYIVF